MCTVHNDQFPSLLTKRQHELHCGLLLITCMNVIRYSMTWQYDAAMHGICMLFDEACLLFSNNCMEEMEIERNAGEDERVKARREEKY